MSGEGPGRVGAREGRCEEARGQGGEGARGARDRKGDGEKSRGGGQSGAGFRGSLLHKPLFTAEGCSFLPRSSILPKSSIP